MANRIISAAIFIITLFIDVKAYSQTRSDSAKINWKSPRENYDYKYAYHGKGIYYIHGEPVARKDYDFYIHKCDSISKANGHATIFLSGVPEADIISEGAYYGTNSGFISAGLSFTMPFSFFLKDSAAAHFKNFSLNWKVLLGINGTEYFYFHTNGESAIISKIPLGNGQSSNGNTIGIDILTIFVLTLPEGISYTFPFKNWRLSAFVNPLGGDYWKDAKINYKTGASTFDFGIKPGFVTHSKMTVGFMLGYRMLYADGYNRGFEGGLSLGWQLY